MKLRKGDTVRVITGKDKGAEGVVERVYPKTNKVLVSGVNTAAKHQVARRANEQLLVGPVHPDAVADG